MTDDVRQYSTGDLKKLFALSYNECAFPGCEQRLADARWPRVAAEIAHIYGVRPSGPRYVPAMTVAERNSYENLLLLCRNHHQVVDYLEPELYPADRLLEMKRSHEERRGDRTAAWCSEAELDEHVRRLAATLHLVVDERARTRSRTASPPAAKQPPARPHGRVRVYELAQELGMTNRETLDLCIALGIGVKSHSSSIENAQGDRVRRKAEREGLRRPIVAAPG